MFPARPAGFHFFFCFQPRRLALVFTLSFLLHPRIQTSQPPPTHLSNHVLSVPGAFEARSRSSSRRARSTPTSAMHARAQVRLHSSQTSYPPPYTHSLPAHRISRSRRPSVAPNARSRASRCSRRLQRGPRAPFTASSRCRPRSMRRRRRTQLPQLGCLPRRRSDPRFKLAAPRIGSSRLENAENPRAAAACCAAPFRRARLTPRLSACRLPSFTAVPPAHAELNRVLIPPGCCPRCTHTPWLKRHTSFPAWLRAAVPRRLRSVLSPGEQ